MNLRKFYLIVCSGLFVILFCSGLLILNRLNDTEALTASNSPFGGILDPFLDNKPMNVLLLGGDKVNKNSDTIMVINYNPLNSKISILSIPRDTMVKIEDRTRKINFAYPHGGAELTKDTIKTLLGIKIDYYVYIDISVFREIVDILGGVEIDIPADMKYRDPLQKLYIDLKKGLQVLDGEKAEQFMRFRKPSSKLNKKGAEVYDYYDGSDLKRIDAQQNFMKEIIKQKANIMYLPKLKAVINTLFSEIKTDLAMSDAIKLAQQATSIKMDNITFYKLFGDDRYVKGASYFIFEGKILNNTTKDKFDAESIIAENFSSSTGFIVQDLNKIIDTSDSDSTKKGKTSTNKKDVTKNNPSNSDSSMKGSTKPQP